MDSSEPSPQSSLPLQRIFSGTQRPFLQENSPGLQATTVEKGKERERRRQIPERGSSFYKNSSEAASLATTVLLVRVVSAVIISIADPEARLAVTIAAFQLRRLTLCKYTVTTSSKSGSTQWPQPQLVP